MYKHVNFINLIIKTIYSQPPPYMYVHLYLAYVSDKLLKW